MDTRTIPPLAFEPILMPRLWGGRRLALFGKHLPRDIPIGESWELVSLAEHESRVAGDGATGVPGGTSLAELVTRAGAALLGDAALHAGRFPLLVKFLDAAQHLSVQVHPRPGPPGPPGSPRPPVKHEAWYVIHAEPDAKVFIGLRPGVTASDFAAAAGTPRLADLLAARPARAGDLFYLPSGVVHALGAGLLVAEVQTPADVTYRLYDWDRVDPAGKPRPLHLEAGLANVRWDVAPAEIEPARSVMADGGGLRRTQLCRNPHFVIEHGRLAAGAQAEVRAADRFRIWIGCAGQGWIEWAGGRRPFAAGDTLLLPAAVETCRLAAESDLELLEVRSG